MRLLLAAAYSAVSSFSTQPLGGATFRGTRVHGLLDDDMTVVVGERRCKSFRPVLMVGLTDSSNFAANGICVYLAHSSQGSINITAIQQHV